VVSKLDSRWKGRGFESHQKLDGNALKKAIPGFIPIPNPGLDSTCKGKKMQVTKWGTPKKPKKHVLSEPYTILGSIFNVK